MISKSTRIKANTKLRGKKNSCAFYAHVYPKFTGWKKSRDKSNDHMHGKYIYVVPYIYTYDWSSIHENRYVIIVCVWATCLRSLSNNVITDNGTFGQVKYQKLCIALNWVITEDFKYYASKWRVCYVIVTVKFTTSIRRIRLPSFELFRVFTLCSFHW